jgi:hypothetical protein
MAEASTALPEDRSRSQSHAPSNRGNHPHFARCIRDFARNGGQPGLGGYFYGARATPQSITLFYFSPGARIRTLA